MADSAEDEGSGGVVRKPRNAFLHYRAHRAAELSEKLKAAAAERGETLQGGFLSRALLSEAAKEWRELSTVSSVFVFSASAAAHALLLHPQAERAPFAAKFEEEKAAYAAYVAR